MIAELFRALISWRMLVIALLVFSFAPGVLLRVIVRAFPRDDPRRREWPAELHAVPRIERPFWVIEQLVVALFDGIGKRFRLRVARHRARRLIRAARAHFKLGEMETAGQVAADALAQATKAGDNWSIGWALHVRSIVTGNQGQTADALPPFEQALTVTQADPKLTDLRSLLLLNQAIAFGDLDQYEKRSRRPARRGA